jgi:N-acyl-D-amino-acid deacylase
VGRVADVAVFDPDTVRQNATYDEPWQLATGVSTVLVGGNVAVDAGRVVPERFGQALRKNG